MNPRIEEVLAFWFRDCRDDPRLAAAMTGVWFAVDSDFDLEIRERFRSLHEHAANGDLDNWRVTARGSLALILLLDQFPRNIFRGTARAFATDAAAVAVCKRGLERDYLAQLHPTEQVFFIMPLSHSEQRVDQDRCAELFDELIASCPDELREHLALGAEFARQHCAVIQRFGRFPHRNAVLGRASTAAEVAFLRDEAESWGQ